MESKISLILADDHPIVRWGVKAFLDKYPQFNVVAQVNNSTELFEALEKFEVDVVVTDYSMPGGLYGDGSNMLERIQRLYPNVKIIILTLLKNSGLLTNLFQTEVHGILNKEGEIQEIENAITAVLAGKRYFGKSVKQIFNEADIYHKQMKQAPLSAREIEVIRLFLGGMPMTKIASITFRSIKTISNQKQSALKKLGCTSDAELFQLKALGGLANILPDSKNQTDNAE